MPVVSQNIVFTIKNASAIAPHGFAIAGPDVGPTRGDTGPIPPGATVELRVTFAAEGIYTAFDSVDGNRLKGGEVQLTVVT